MGVFTILTRSGVADDDQQTTLSRLAEELRRPKAQLLLHLHGGLVDEDAGRAAAERLSGNGDDGWKCGEEWTQVYVVWRTGALEEMKAHWRELAHDDKLYQAVLRKLISFVARRLNIPIGPRRGAGAVELSDDDIHRRIVGLEDRLRPFGDFDDSLDQVTPKSARTATVWAEEDDGVLSIDFEDELRDDEQFQIAAREVDEAVNVPSGARGPARGVDQRAGEAMLSRLDANIRTELEPQVVDPITGRRGPVTVSAFLLAHAGRVALSCFRRFRAGRDHGLHATIVEELCREFYGDLIGSRIWGMMVGDAGRHFAHGAFGETLTGILKETGTKRIVVTAHSAGSIWASHLLMALRKVEVPIEVALFLLAPAIRADLFARTIQQADGLVHRCRMITMTDEAERQDPVLGKDLGYIYPSSLLYLVSGMFELDRDDPYPDAPLVGLQRFAGADWLTPEESASARLIAEFFEAPDRDIICSPAEGVTGATSHGAFDDDKVMLATVRAMF